MLLQNAILMTDIVKKSNQDRKKAMETFPEIMFS